MIIKIFELAQRRRDVAAWIEDKTFPVLVALAQLYLFPDIQYVNHWRQEVWSNFNRVKFLMGRNKVPSKEFILKSGWEVNKKYVKRYLDYTLGKEYQLEPIANMDSDVFYEIAESYFDWLAEKLSEESVVSPKEVYSKLEELGL